MIIGSRIAAACVIVFLIQIAYTERTSLLMPLLFPKHEYLAFFVELFALLALIFGIQFACSRICAALLLLYGFALPAAATALEGEAGVAVLLGLALIVAGILSIRGTFGVRREYEKCLRDGTLPVSEAEEAEEVLPVREAERGRKIDDVTKREFFAQYASAKNRRIVAVSALSACIFSLYSIAMAVFKQNNSQLCGCILVIVLAMGVQFFKSRVCAGVLLAYTFIDIVLGIVNAGGLYTGAMFGVGIGAMIGTFALHREWAAFKEDSTVLTENEQRKLEQKQKKVNEKSYGLVFIPAGGMFLGMGLVALFMHPYLVKHFTKAADSIEMLLQGYIDWYTAIIFVLVAALLLPLVAFALAARTGYLKRCSPMTAIQSILILVVSVAGPLLFGGILLVGADVPGLITQTKEDLAQIESGELREVTVWLSPKSHAARMPGLSGSGYPEPFTRYAGISHETDGEWVWFYVPQSLGFSPDLSAPYKESKSVQWNEENARQYQILYTDNLRVVVSIEPTPTFL